MGLEIISGVSHLDHGLTTAVIEHIRELFAGKDGFFIETIALPPELGHVECALHFDVSETDVFYARRGPRTGDSRMCRLPPRMVSEVSVIAGPTTVNGEAKACVLYTAFGGPVAPREPFDSYFGGEMNDAKATELAAAKAFWAKAALSASAFGL